MSAFTVLHVWSTLAANDQFPPLSTMSFRGPLLPFQQCCICCGAAQQTGLSLQVLDREVGERQESGTFQPLPFRVFADAESARRRGKLVAAVQPMSSERSLKVNLRREIQTVLSPQLEPTIKERDFAAYCPRSYC